MSISPKKGHSAAPETHSSYQASNFDSPHSHKSQIDHHLHKNDNNNNNNSESNNNNSINHEALDVGGARRATVVSSTASHQHQQEQELLSNFAVPAPPLSTKELTLAASNDAVSEQSLMPESPRTLWMGDLDPWLDEAAIVNLWLQILGQDVSVKLIRPRSLRLGTGAQEQGILPHAGYCFVEFPLFEAAQQALGLNGQLLPDIAMPSQEQFKDNPDNQKKYFRVNWALGATLTAPIVESPEFSLFVGDLSASTTEAHLLLFFQKLFPNLIHTVRVMTDPVSGKSRCFGFVRFTDEQKRQRALKEMNGVWFGGRPLRVANATPRLSPLYRRNQQDMRPYTLCSEILSNEMVYGQLQLQLQPQSNLSLAAQGYYALPMMNSMGSEIPQMQYGSNMGSMGIMNNGMSNMGNMGSMGGAQFVDPTNTTVFVGGLLSDINDQTLFTLFQPFGMIVQIKLPPGKNCGFVKYSTREEAENAILNMEGFVIGGHRVRLGWGRISSSNKQYRRKQMTQMQMQATAMSMGYDPSSVYAPGVYTGMSPQLSSAQGQVFAPMAVQMRPPGMYHYMGNPELLGEYDQAPTSDLTPHIIRSRSLDNNMEEATNVRRLEGTGHSYFHEHLAENFDSLSLNAASQYCPGNLHSYGGLGSYNVYPQVSKDQQQKQNYSSSETQVHDPRANSAKANNAESSEDKLLKAADNEKDSVASASANASAGPPQGSGVVEQTQERSSS